MLDISMLDRATTKHFPCPGTIKYTPIMEVEKLFHLRVLYLMSKCILNDPGQEGIIEDHSVIISTL